MSTKRRIGFAGLALFALLGLAQVVSGQAPALERALVINGAGGTFGDSVRTAYVIPFQGEIGIEVTYVGGNDDQAARLQAQAAANKVEWDVLTGYDAPYYRDLLAKGLLATIDYSQIGPAADRLSPGARQPWGVGFQYDGWGIAYDAKAFPAPPASVTDFFDVTRFPGNRMIPNWGQPDTDIIAALLADGVPPERLTPFDYARAFRKLDAIKPSIKVFYESGNQLVSALVDGRAVLCLCIDGRALQAAQLKPSIQMVWKGGWRSVSYWVIAKQAPHPRAAHAFIRSTLAPARQATFTSLMGYSGVVPEAYALLTKERRESVLLNPENFRQTFELRPDQIEWLAQHRQELNDRWTEWVSR